jgi:hypothetical protein
VRGLIIARPALPPETLQTEADPSPPPPPLALARGVYAERWCVQQFNRCRRPIALPGLADRRTSAQSTERQKPKFGRWWRQYGYAGPRYCQRCSEVFRDHIMRQKPNSAGCQREAPCDDCAKVLNAFGEGAGVGTVSSREPLWRRFDERARNNKLKRSLAS